MKPSSILSSPARDRGVADLPDQRQERILGEVARNGGARVSELTELLGVSDMTVRRDLDTLARRGLVRKVHGGATLPRRGSSDEPGFEAKSGQERPAKHALAHYLARVPELTVVTNSLPVAEVLDASGRPDQTVVLSGGIRTPSDALVGPVAVRAIRSLHVDWAFMGVHGIHPEAGFTSPNLLEAETNRAVLASARRLVVLADHTKWQVVGLSTIAAIEQASVVITDSRLPEVAREALAARVGELILVDPEEA